MGIDFRPRHNCRECKRKLLGCAIIEDPAIARNMLEIKSSSPYNKNVAIINSPSNKQHKSYPSVKSNYVRRTAELDSLFDHASLDSNRESVANIKISTPQNYTLPSHSFENHNWDALCGAMNDKDCKTGTVREEESASVLSSGIMTEEDNARNISNDAHHVLTNEDHKLIRICKRRRCSCCYSRLALKFGRDIAKRQSNKTTSTCSICNKHMCKRCFSLHI